MVRPARLLWLLRRELRGLLRVLRHARTPIGAKLMLIVAVAYLLWPLDVVPDWLIPLVGFVDDAVIVPLFFWLSLRLVPRDVLAECRAKADDEASGQ